MGIAPHEATGEPFRIGVEQKLVCIEAMAAFRIVGAVYAIAVTMAGEDVRKVSVPDVFGAFGQGDALELAPSLAIEQTEPDLFGIRREQCKVGATPLPPAPQRPHPPAP